LVTCRSEKEFAKSSIANAINFPIEQTDVAQYFDSIELPDTELQHTVLLYHGDVEKEKAHLTNVSEFFADLNIVSSVYVMQEQFEAFEREYPFVCKISQNVYPSQLLLHLYLGSALVATNPDVIKELGITHILNTETGIQDKSDPIPPMSNVKIHRNGYDENDEKSIRKFFDDSIHFIEEAQKANGKVLVYCHRGESKAPVIALLYLMRSLGWTYEEAEAYIKRARPVVELYPPLREVAEQIELEIFNYDQ